MMAQFMGPKLVTRKIVVVLCKTVYYISVYSQIHLIKKFPTFLKKPKLYYVFHSTAWGPSFVPYELSPQLHTLLI